MAGTDGQTTDPVNILEALESNPYAFDFFRAVRLLECRSRDLPKIGYSFSPAKDPVRFAQKPSLIFAPSTLEGLERPQSTGTPQLFVRFFGLFGPNAPLPPHLTEYAYEREWHHDDRTIRSFCNVFHHRLISFFYRAWADNQKALDLDRDQDQRFATYLGSFFGMGLESLQNQDAVQDWAKLYFAGRLACQTRNAEGLEAILQEYFTVPAEIQSFVGRWMNLPANSLCKLGDSPETGRLGLTTIVGERFWECQLNFRVKLGPMSLQDYERMLPVGAAFRRLKYWILNYCGEHYSWDVQLVLRAGEVPATALGQTGRLGWTTWLKTKPFTRDADDLALIPPHHS
jgi:type VI secretion system protein ImpH